MAAGRIEIKHIFPSETDYVIWTWRKTSNLLTEIGREVYAAPHPQETLLVTDIDPTMYLVTAYRSSDGVALDAELDVQLAVDASSGSQYSTVTYEYVVDRGYNNVTPVATGSEVWADPVSGQNELRDERLIDKDYIIIERGTSQLLASEITNFAGGGFDFATSGKNFETEGVYFAIVQVRQDVSVVSGGSTDLNDVVLITADTTFSLATHANKVLLAAYSGANKVLTLTLPNLSLIADCKFRMQSQGGTQRYFALQLDAGDTLTAYGDDLNVIYLGKGECIEFLVKDNIIYATSPLTGYEKLGQRIWGERVELNTFRRDGTLYNQVDVPRLMQFVNQITYYTEAQWASSVVVNGETVYPYKGFYAVDNIAAIPTVRVPDSRGKSIRALLADTGDAERSTQGAGSYQHAKTSMKGVKVGIRNGSGGSSTGSISNTGFSGQDNYSSWVTENGSTEDHIRFNNASDGFTGTDELRLINEGMIPLICI